ncbi:hypothetical protein P3S68_020308 [Capsicum galapagoense]
MGKDEEKPVFVYQKSDQFYQTNNPQLFHQIHHQGYVEPFPGYRNNAYAQQNFQYYDYNYPARPLPYVSTNVSQGFSFCRVMLCIMLFFILFTMIMSMLTIILFMTYKPSFILESFVVPTFDISGDVGPGAALKANWETKMDVKNTNHRSSVVIKHMETTLIYRSVELDMSSKDNVEVQKESTVHIMDGFSFPSTRKSYNIEWVVTEIAKDRKRGEIMFDLKIEVQVMIKSRVLIKIDKLRLYCESITLNFKNISSNIPTWDGSNRECKSGL